MTRDRRSLGVDCLRFFITFGTELSAEHSSQLGDSIRTRIPRGTCVAVSWPLFQAHLQIISVGMKDTHVTCYSMIFLIIRSSNASSIHQYPSCPLKGPTSVGSYLHQAHAPKHQTADEHSSREWQTSNAFGTPFWELNMKNSSKTNLDFWGEIVGVQYPPTMSHLSWEQKRFWNALATPAGRSAMKVGRSANGVHRGWDGKTRQPVDSAPS